MSRILVVDDKELMRDSVATTLVRRGHTVVTVGSAKQALEKLALKPCDAVITDLQMPEMDGLELLRGIRQIDEQIPVVLMTAYGTVETAVAAMKEGAYDYITKPFSGDELLVAVERAIKHGELTRENQILKAAATPTGNCTPTNHELIGTTHAITELCQRLSQIADSHGTVLITGESGSGKEVAANWVHQHSPRADKPFLAINCAALSTNLLESELFGHEKGAFTGADKLRKGRFELADGGTLLLDEISEIAPEIQAKLLRVLQEHTFERVGSSSSRGADVRVIATTNRDLPSEVATGRFRQDLYFRLNVLPVAMPALRTHVSDIDDLAAHFLKQVATREGKPVKHIEPAALELMKNYTWPGNVRELQNICERAAVLTNSETITASLLEPWLTGRVASEGAAAVQAREYTYPHPQPVAVGTGVNSTNGTNATAHRTYAQPVGGATPGVVGEFRKPASMIEAATGAGGDEERSIIDPNHWLPVICNGDCTLDEIERKTIVATLKHFNGHRQRSAKALGIGVRTLGLKLKKWKEEKLVAETL